MTNFICPVCGEEFSEPVWHCPVCRHHWPMHREDCWNCHKFDRFEDGAKIADAYLKWSLSQAERRNLNRSQLAMLALKLEKQYAGQHDGNKGPSR